MNVLPPLTITLTVDAEIRRELESLRNTNVSALAALRERITASEQSHDALHCSIPNCAAAMEIDSMKRVLESGERLQEFLVATCDQLKATETAIRERN